jgi:hypothetical protein
MAETWEDPAWLATVQTWIDERLGELGRTRTGELEQPHVRTWSTALRVPTDGGVVWFKATVPGLAHEAPLTALLAERRPDVVPPPLAWDPTTGWMISDDAGARLRDVEPEERWLAGWHDVLPRYAALQVELTGDADRLVALGVPDRRLATLPEQYAALMDELTCEPEDARRFRDAQPHVVDLCAELASYGVGETVQHDDLHDAQVFVRDGRYRVLDWGDACVSHPFFTLSVTFEGLLSWGLHDVEDSVDTRPFRDEYLAPFAAAYPGVDLVAALQPALRLGWISRALNGHLYAGGEGGEDGAMTGLRMFLDRSP